MGIYAALRSVGISSPTPETEWVVDERFTHSFGYGVQPLT